jgi:hypothetical protein
MQAHTMTTVAMLFKLLPMTAPADLDIDVALTPFNSRVIRSMAIDTVKLAGMSAGQQLAIGRALPVAFKTIPTALLCLNRGRQ